MADLPEWLQVVVIVTAILAAVVGVQLLVDEYETRQARNSRKGASNDR